MLTWTRYIDLGLIPACDCHQLFILLLWYFKPEASLNYVANWSILLVAEQGSLRCWVRGNLPSSCWTMQAAMSSVCMKALPSWLPSSNFEFPLTYSHTNDMPGQLRWQHNDCISYLEQLALTQTYWVCGSIFNAHFSKRTGCKNQVLAVEHHLFILRQC